jgi:hypothetical protein
MVGSNKGLVINTAPIKPEIKQAIKRGARYKVFKRIINNLKKIRLALK